MSPKTEIIIQTVQKYRVLYDISHREYKNIRLKNKIWDNIAVIIGEGDGDTLKKQWKNLRDAYSKHLRSCKTSTGQAAKLTERYKTWPWATLMSFLSPHLEFAETHSNIQHSNDEEGGSSQPSHQFAETHSNTQHSNDEEGGSSQPFHQGDTPQHVHSRRKRNVGTSQVDKVIDYMNKNTEKDDDTDLLFKSYAKKLKKMTHRRQATIKFEIAKIILQAELDEADDLQGIADAAQQRENNDNMIMIVQPPASSAGSDTNDSVYIVSSPPPVDPLGSTFSRAGGNEDTVYMVNSIQPSHTYSSISHNLQSNSPLSNTLPSSTHTFQEDQRPNCIDPSQYILQPNNNNNSSTRMYYEHFGEDN